MMHILESTTYMRRAIRLTSESEADSEQNFDRSNDLNRAFPQKLKRTNSAIICKDELEKYRSIQLSDNISQIKSTILRIHLKLKQHTQTTVGSAHSVLVETGLDNRTQDRSDSKNVHVEEEINEIKNELDELETFIDVQSKKKETIITKYQSYFKSKPATNKESPKSSKGLLDWLDYLFMLQWIPKQYLNTLPVSLNTYFDSLSSGSTISTDESMSNNLLRLHSFNNYPRSVNIFVSNMCKAGFYYTGYADKVQCYACGITNQNWKRGDDPMEIHRRLSPSCPHLHDTLIGSSNTNGRNQNVTSGDAKLNNPATQSISTPSINLQSSTDIQQNCATSDDQSRNVSSITRYSTSLSNGTTGHNQLINNNTNQNARQNPNSNYVTNSSEHNKNKNGRCSETELKNTHQHGACGCYDATSSNQTSNNDISTLGIDLDKPRYPNYAALQVRISSFQGWPSYLDQTPKQMATAGFLFAGYQDYTRCFFCGGGLRNWEAGDDPWVEHARWSPKCTYLRQNKGDKFIKAVQDKHEQLDKERTQKSGQFSSLQLQEATQNVDPLHSNSNQQPYSSTRYLDTAAAKSVLEMGYTHEQVLQAIQHLQSDNSDGTFTATDIMTVLLENDTDENRPNTSSESASTVCVRTSPNSMSINSCTPASSAFNGTSANGWSPNATTPANEAPEPLANSLNESNVDDAELLVEENRQLRDQRLCKICLELDASIAFLPCGHLVCCTDCAPAMRKCPICRAYVKGTVKTFLV